MKLPGLGSKRGWFESSAVHEFYGGVAQLVERFVRIEEVMDSTSITFHYGHLAQPDFRASRYERGGREFDPLSDYE